MTRHLSRGLMIFKLQQRFKKLNPNGDWDNVDVESIDYPCEYGDALNDVARANPNFKFFEDNDPYQIRLSAEDMERQRYEEELEENRKSVKIKLKLCFQKSKKGEKYAYVKGTVEKKLFKKYGERLFTEVVLDWPLIEIVEDEQEQDAPNALFDEKKVEDEKTEDYQEHPNALFESLNEKKTREDEDHDNPRE